MIPLWMLYAAILATLLGAAAAAAERLLRYGGGSGRWVWMGALAASVVLPAALWRSSVSGSSLGASVRHRLGIAEGSGAEAVRGVPDSGADLGTPSVMGTWVQDATGTVGGALAAAEGPLLWAWLAGSAILFVGVLGASLTLRRRARSWGRAWVQGERVLISRDVGPAVMGVWRPRVVLPSWALGLGRRSLEVVLLHEREHVAGRDLWFVHAALLALVAMPWNPALWWQLRRLRLAVEVDCDRRVLSRGVAPKRYGEVLLEVEGRAGGAALNVLALGEPTAFLRRRFQMMTEAMAPQTNGNRSWKAALAGFAGLAALAVACEAPAPPEPEASEEAPEEAREAPDRPDLAEQPQFTPFTRSPRVENVDEVEAHVEEVHPGVEGEVVVAIFITDEGEIENSQIDREAEHPEVNEAALEVLQTFEFSPAYNRGEPVPVWITLPIHFAAPD